MSGFLIFVKLTCQILLFEPTHFADPSAGRVVHRLAEPNQLEFLELKATEQIASPEVRQYPQSTVSSPTNTILY